jgi:hypothetical protein
MTCRSVLITKDRRIENVGHLLHAPTVTVTSATRRNTPCTHWGCCGSVACPSSLCGLAKAATVYHRVFNACGCRTQGDTATNKSGSASKLSWGHCNLSGHTRKEIERGQSSKLKALAHHECAGLSHNRNGKTLKGFFLPCDEVINQSLPCTDHRGQKVFVFVDGVSELLLLDFLSFLGCFLKLFGFFVPRPF